MLPCTEKKIPASGMLSATFSEAAPLPLPEWPAQRPCRSTIPNWRRAKRGSSESISMIRSGGVPALSSL